MNRFRLILIFSIVLTVFFLSCDDQKNQPPSPGARSNTDKNVHSSERTQGYCCVDEEFCPWCNTSPLMPGIPPLPPVGYPGTPPSNPAPGDPSSNWTYADYMNDPRFAPFLEGLNAQEVAFFAAAPWRIPAAQGNQKAAVMKADELYFNGNTDHTNANAFKHAYWSKLNALSFGVDAARALGEAHEANSDAMSKTMDLFNNNIGLTTPGNLHGWPPPGRPVNLYFLPTILKSIEGGWALRIDTGNPLTGKIVKTDGTGRK